MTQPGTSEALTALIRDFMARMRHHLLSIPEQGDREIFVERIFAAIAAAGSAVLTLLPARRRRDLWAEALLAVATRLWMRRRFHVRPAVVLDTQPGTFDEPEEPDHW